MADLRERLERVAAAAPPRRPTFDEDVRRRIAADERARGRRRLAAITGALALTAAALAAGGVRAFDDASTPARTIDETRTCIVQEQGGIPVVYVKAYAHYRFRNNGRTFTFPPFAGFADRQGNTLGTVGLARHGYGISDPPLCTGAPRVPLTRGTLPLLGAYANGSPGLGGGTGGNGAECWVGTHVTARIQVHVGKNDTPTSARLALRSGKKLRPVVFVEWTPNRVAVYASDACRIP